MLGAWPTQREWEAENVFDVVAARLRRQHRSALLRAIPDDPDFRRHVPIEYRLDAAPIVQSFSYDLRKPLPDLSRGGSVGEWAEAAHWGIAAAEIFAESSLLVAGLAIAGPVLALVGEFAALAAPYIEAAKEIAARESARGFSRGVAMGADRRQARQVTETFGHEFFPRNDFFPRGRDVAMANYRVGLAAGYYQGRLLTENQRAIFWHDLGRRMVDQPARGPQAQWSERDWWFWYADVASAFRVHHLVPTR